VRLSPSSVTCPFPFSNRRSHGWLNAIKQLIRKKNVHTSGSVSYAIHSQKLHHKLEHAPTFHELFDQTHKRKGTNDYVNESARTIAETYDKTMADRYAAGTP
ncbi:hypothetical protein Taro_041337, partial [Colocasia esculenta]|nr:hypothetical protein [Colocasia esculenta]